MQEEVKQQITQAMTEWIDSTNPNRTQAALVLKSGCSTTEVSLIARGIYFNGAHKGKNYDIKDAVFQKLIIALGLSLQDTEVHWDTKNFIKIQQMCQVFRLRKKVGMFDSEDSGVGKTYGLEYVSTFEDLTVYVKITRTMGVRDLLQEVAFKLIGNKVKEERHSVRRLLEMIREKVLTQQGYLLIFDEMEYAKNAIFHIIKEIIDFTYNRCAVVTSGMRLEAYLEKLDRRNKFGFKQLKRRLCTNVVRLSPVQNTDRTVLLASYNITNTKAVAWFNANVHDFQMMAEYIKDIMEWSEYKEGKEITFDLLNQRFKGQ